VWPLTGAFLLLPGERHLPQLLDHRPHHLLQGSGFRVQGSGFRVQGSGLRVQRAQERDALERHAAEVAPEIWSGSEEGSDLRLVDCCVTQL